MLIAMLRFYLKSVILYLNTVWSSSNYKPRVISVMEIQIHKHFASAATEVLVFSAEAESKEAHTKNQLIVFQHNKRIINDEWDNLYF